MLITHNRLVRDLRELGVLPGRVVMIHASMRAVGPVLGGPDVVIRALLDVVEAAGTIMMYVDWQDGVQHLTRHEAAERLDWELLNELPPFDPRTSRARRENGILCEFLRTWPAALRSGNPDASVAAIGHHAAWLCQDHPLDYGYGPGSPLAKLVEAEGQVLLLGSPLGSVTLLHYAEHMARIPGKRIIRYREPMLVQGSKQWVAIEEFDTSDPVVPQFAEDYFADLVQEYVSLGKGRSGSVGHAAAHLFDAAELYHYAVDWMERHAAE